MTYLNTDNNTQTTNIPQSSSETNTSNFYSNSTNYAVQDIKKVTEPFKKQESYNKDEMAEVWNNEVSNNNYDAYYNSDGNIERYIAIEEDGNNIVVNQYDNNDNVVKSEVIPSENGKYNVQDIQDTISRVASLYDENRPIKGQQDIEGNEVKSMKKNSNLNITKHKRTFEKEIENYKKINKTKNVINGETLEINNNVLEGISKNKQGNFLNEYLKNEIQGKDFYNEHEKIIATRKNSRKIKKWKN